jgi:branched-chain amino acid transport system permease protein
MKTSLTKGLRSGIVFGIVFIFLMLIGFINVGADMVSDISGASAASGAGGRLPVGDLLIVIAVFGVFCGIAARSKSEEVQWWSALLGGLTAGITAGLLMGVAIWLVGSLSLDGVDFRTYLPSLNPASIQYLTFYSYPQSAGLTYLMYMAIFSVAGAALAWLLSFRDWLAKSWNSCKTGLGGWFEKKDVSRIFSNQWLMIVVFLAAGILLYFLPLAWGSYWNYIMGTVAIYILLGLGLNIIVGYSGQLVLGYVAFFATGAYTFALLTAPTPHGIEMNLWLAVGLSILVSTLTGLLLGLPILNLRGDYLAIVTLGFGEIVRILIRSDLLTSLTNGPKGVTSVGQPNLFGSPFSDVNFMHLLMLLVLIGLFIAKRLKDSNTGRAWIAIREDQTVAQATGINTFKHKILALLLGAAFAGLAGALFASRNQFTGPEDFTLMVSVNVLCIVIVGGMGSLPGVVLGAFVLKGIPELLREMADYRLLVFGALLVVMMIVRPEGLWPARRVRFKRSHADPDRQDAMEVEV